MNSSRITEALTCLADARLSSPKGRGMPWHTWLANVSASDTPRLSSAKGRGMPWLPLRRCAPRPPAKGDKGLAP